MQELTIPLDAGEKQPLYLQIYTFIRREAEAGRIVRETSRGSARALALQLNVSRSTVDLAYGQLVAGRAIWKLIRAGVFPLRSGGSGASGSAGRNVQGDPGRAEGGRGDSLGFYLSGIAPDGFPCNVWRKLSREVLASDDGSLFQLGDPQGDRG